MLDPNTSPTPSNPLPPEIEALMAMLTSGPIKLFPAFTPRTPHDDLVKQALMLTFLSTKLIREQLDWAELPEHLQRRLWHSCLDALEALCSEVFGPDYDQQKRPLTNELLATWFTTGLSHALEVLTADPFSPDDSANES